MTKTPYKKSRKLNPKELRETRKLVTAMCANYDKQYDCCPLLDDYGCYMMTLGFSGSSLCKYFEKAVLPLSPALIAIFLRKQAKPCELCGGSYIPTGRRQKYCADCQLTAKRAATANRVKKQRRKDR